jgi:hypothetical protein
MVDSSHFGGLYVEKQLTYLKLCAYFLNLYDHVLFQGVLSNGCRKLSMSVWLAPSGVVQNLVEIGLSSVRTPTGPMELHKLTFFLRVGGGVEEERKEG